jgi:hypothetical protein
LLFASLDDGIGHRRNQVVQQNVFRFIKIGILAATALAAYAVVVTVLTEGEALVKYGPGVSLPKILLFYYLGGIAGGFVIGILQPLSASLVGSMVLGFMVALITGFFFIITLLPKQQWGDVLPLASLLFAFALGPGAGAINWYYDRTE